MFKQHQTLLTGLVVVFSLAMISACQKSGIEEAISKAEEVAVESVESWDTFVSRQIEEHLVAHPQFAVVQGRHEFDGQLPDWSRAGIEAEIARLHAVKGLLKNVTEHSLIPRVVSLFLSQSLSLTRTFHQGGRGIDIFNVKSRCKACFDLFLVVTLCPIRFRTASGFTFRPILLKP